MKKKKIFLVYSIHNCTSRQDIYIYMYGKLPFVEGEEGVGDGVVQVDAVTQEPELGRHHHEFQHERRCGTHVRI